MNLDLTDKNIIYLLSQHSEVKNNLSFIKKPIFEALEAIIFEKYEVETLRKSTPFFKDLNYKRNLYEDSKDLSYTSNLSNGVLNITTYFEFKDPELFTGSNPLFGKIIFNVDLKYSKEVKITIEYEFYK